jgi:hypothetical protein
MDADALKRMEAKLDRVLELLEDISLGADGIELIEELDRMVKTKRSDELAEV